MQENDNVQINAVCDIYTKRLNAAAELTHAPPTRNFLYILANTGVDYVLIATPEHWHSRMTLDAIASGKHIYCEKPLTRTVEQARKVVEAMSSRPVKLQVGVQGTSDDSYREAYKYVKDGALGKVVLAQIDYSRNHKDDFWMYDIDADAKPGPDLSVAFNAYRTGEVEVWRCDAETGENCQQLTVSGGGTPRWSPDSRWLALDFALEGKSQVPPCLPPEGNPGSSMLPEQTIGYRVGPTMAGGFTSSRIEAGSGGSGRHRLPAALPCG